MTYSGLHGRRMRVTSTDSGGVVSGETSKAGVMEDGVDRRYICLCHASAASSANDGVTKRLTDRAEALSFSAGHPLPTADAHL
jgi:hypothetical protein